MPQSSILRAIFVGAIVLNAAVPGRATPTTGPYPITHVIMIMQENRSFDNYFGTYPGANGIPNGTCVPLNPANSAGGCVVPFHDQHDVNSGGPHLYANAMADLDNGITATLMDGFIYQQTAGAGKSCSVALHPPGIPGTGCHGIVPGVNRHDVVGYHTAAEIPNYWAYAKHFVLQDEMFESVRSWSLDAHLGMTSEWVANCKKPTMLSTCVTSLNAVAEQGTTVLYPWVNLFQLMDSHGVSWKYYLGQGTEPDCADGQMTCDPQTQRAGILSIWNPAPGFAWVEQQGAAYLAAHNPNLDQFLLDIKNGTLPQVSWIVPGAAVSEHPVSGITEGMEYVTSLVNAVMQSPYWQSTAIYISWDDWGGFYDHVPPPVVDWDPAHSQVQGYGLRVPGLMLSPYARPGLIDHNVLSFDSYAVLIENLFMGGARLDPVAMGQPDSRPDIRDEMTTVTFPNGTTQPIGNLLNEFNFSRNPLPPLILSTHIPVGITIACGSTDANNPQNCGSTSVTISWKPVAYLSVPGPFTYNVFRDGGTQPVCTTTKTLCVDAAAGAGTHYYVVNTVDSSNVTSPNSAAAEADVP